MEFVAPMDDLPPAGAAGTAAESSPAELALSTTTTDDPELEEVKRKYLPRMLELEAAGVDWRERTRKVVRVSEEDCKQAMAITPWPPEIPAHLLDENHYDYVSDDPVIRQGMRKVQAQRLEGLKILHKEWTRVRQDYAAKGYAEMAVDVDRLGTQFIVPMQD